MRWIQGKKLRLLSKLALRDSMLTGFALGGYGQPQRAPRVKSCTSIIKRLHHQGSCHLNIHDTTYLRLYLVYLLLSQTHKKRVSSVSSYAHCCLVALPEVQIAILVYQQQVAALSALRYYIQRKLFLVELNCHVQLLLLLVY